MKSIATLPLTQTIERPRTLFGDCLVAIVSLPRGVWADFQAQIARAGEQEAGLIHSARSSTSTTSGSATHLWLRVRSTSHAGDDQPHWPAKALLRTAVPWPLPFDCTFEPSCAPSCIVSNTVLGTITNVAFCFNPS